MATLRAAADHQNILLMCIECQATCIEFTTGWNRPTARLAPTDTSGVG